MKGIMTLYLDQFGAPIWARTLAELRKKAGGGKVEKMYVDKTAGGTFHIGYVIGRRWFSAFRPVEIPA